MDTGTDSGREHAAYAESTDRSNELRYLVVGKRHLATTLHTDKHVRIVCLFFLAIALSKSNGCCQHRYTKRSKHLLYIFHNA